MINKSRNAESVRVMLEKIKTYGRMIKFSHTIFALPFVLSAVVLAFREHSLGVIDIVWIIIAAVSARSAAMGFNRIADVGFDREKLDQALQSTIPVIAPLGLSEEGVLYNINADDVAFYLAAKVKAEKLVLLTKVLGVMHADSKALIEWEKKHTMVEVDYSYRGKQHYEMKYKNKKIQLATQIEIDGYLSSLEESTVPKKEKDILNALEIDKAKWEKIKKLV